MIQHIISALGSVALAVGIFAVLVALAWLVVFLAEKAMRAFGVYKVLIAFVLRNAKKAPVQWRSFDVDGEPEYDRDVIIFDAHPARYRLLGVAELDKDDYPRGHEKYTFGSATHWVYCDEIELPDVLEDLICANPACTHSESQHEKGLGCWGMPTVVYTDRPTPGCRCKEFVKESQ